jgi:predicted alpha/beta-fold hydrolase
MEDQAFAPAWWLPGPHLQTIGGLLLRRGRGVSLRRERIELADGDFLDLDWCLEADGRRSDPGAPLALVLHGLEGSFESGYVLEMLRRLTDRRLTALVLNFRSCSGEPNRLPRFYHSGDTDDLAAVLAGIRERFPDRRIGAVGFSLGGNVLLKYLGERGRAGASPVVEAAVAVSAPFDLAAGIVKLEHGTSRIYQRYLVRKLRRKVRLKNDALAGHVDVDRLRRVSTIREFDELATAKLHGFRDAEDYYARSSCNQFLSDILVPSLLIHSVDDPFVSAGSIPRTTVAANRSIQAEFTASGGHVGFITGPPWAPRFWAEDRAASFLARRLAH